MSDQFKYVRRQVLRRVRYATNATALRDNRLPPEAPYDAALTNGLLVIVADEWPGAEINSNGQTKAARACSTSLRPVATRFPTSIHPSSGMDSSQRRLSRRLYAPLSFSRATRC